MAFYPDRRTAFDDLIDDVFDFPTFPDHGFASVMKTDIREKDGMYELEIELPGFKKEDVKISLEKGALTISASHNQTEEEKNAKGSIIRQERHTGSASRSWYVGENVKAEDIHATFDNGILKVTLPSGTKKEEEPKKYIDIL
jgi:HSP20 family protein